MTNIINADIYRLRKGAALRNTIIGVFITVAFIAVTMFTFSSEGFSIYLDETASQAGMSDTELQEMHDDIAEADETAMVASGASFAQEMAASNAMPFFLLAIIITVFCADFTAGTHRNTLSYESNRTKVYLGKLLLSIGIFVLLYFAQLVFSWLIGGVFFGFTGFSAEYFLQTLVGFLLMLPVHIGIISIGHCIVAFARKSSVTIAVYLIGLTLVSSFLQMASQLRNLAWLLLLDVISAGHTLVYYWQSAPSDIIITVVFGLVAAVASTALGLARYNKTDMA